MPSFAEREAARSASLRGRLRYFDPGSRSADTNGLYLEQPDIGVQTGDFPSTLPSLPEREVLQHSSLRGRLRYYNPGVRSSDTNGLYLEHFPLNVGSVSRRSSTLSLPDRQADDLAQLRRRLRPRLSLNSGSST